MVKAALLVAVFFTAHTGAAQQKELDSLLGVLRQYSKQDTTRLNLLNDIAFDYSHIDPDKGLVMAEEAMTLARKLGNLPKLASACSYKAMNLASKGNDSAALVYYRQALYIHEKTGNRLRVATTYNNMAIEMVNLSDYPSALDYHAKAYVVFESLNDTMRMANSLNNTGVIHLYLADYPKALTYYLKALGLLEQTGRHGLAADAHRNIGLVYDHLKNYPRSLEYQQKAYSLYAQMDNKEGMAGALGNIGNVYHDMDSSDKALACYRRALQISDSIRDQRGIASSYGNMGIVYNDLRDGAHALEYLQKSLAINTQLGDKKRMAGDLIQIGKLYLDAPAGFLQQLGIPASARYSRAADYEKRAIALGAAIGSPDASRDAWESLYTVYEQQKDFPRALAAYKQYIVLRDSVLNTDTRQEITRREMQFEFEKKEALAKLEREKEQVLAAAALNRQRAVKNITLAGAMFLLAAGLTIFVFYKRRRDAEERRNTAEFNAQVSDTEMKALRSQMNPHFIFNSLNSINDYIDKHDTVTATLYTTRFAKLMRLILEHSEQKEVSLAEDLKALGLYLQLESLRLNHAFTYEITTDGALDPDNTRVPPLLLQPFVENSIWHGLSGKPRGGKILVSIKKEGDRIHCIVEDNGIGRAQSARLHGSATPDKTALGMKITLARIAIINKRKQSQAAVAVYDLEPGTRVELQLPLELTF
ncbi:MAG TPA: tetratricopeptide repeat protein [Chitinophagaceae bacterium]|nr:tetratricopeptide repeat protein [Chitinophagaceae bacterium]